MVATETTRHWSPLAGVTLHDVGPVHAALAAQPQIALPVVPSLAYRHSDPAGHCDATARRLPLPLCVAKPDTATLKLSDDVNLRMGETDVTPSALRVVASRASVARESAMFSGYTTPGARGEREREREGASGKERARERDTVQWPGAAPSISAQAHKTWKERREARSLKDRREGARTREARGGKSPGTVWIRREREILLEKERGREAR